jgi:hypothetical protein
MQSKTKRKNCNWNKAAMLNFKSKRILLKSFLLNDIYYSAQGLVSPTFYPQVGTNQKPSHVRWA